MAALGGHVIKTGCAPYLIDWVRWESSGAVVLNGAAAIHDFELALAGKTSEDVAAHLPTGHFGMARETADAFAVAARIGAEYEHGLGWRWDNTSTSWIARMAIAALSSPPTAPIFLARSMSL